MTGNHETPVWFPSLILPSLIPASLIFILTDPRFPEEPAGPDVRAGRARLLLDSTIVWAPGQDSRRLFFPSLVFPSLILI